MASSSFQMSNQRSLKVGIGGHHVDILCRGKEAHSLADFLFGDLVTTGSDTPVKHYEFGSDTATGNLTLWDDGTRLYSSKSRYLFSYFFMNEVIYQCITNNTTHHAIHAGTVHRNGVCVALPGGSGRGKSTVTAWLLTQKFHYLTDELILLSNDGAVVPFTRPLNLKSCPEFLSEIVDNNQDRIIAGKEEVMIPHRLLNPDFLGVQIEVGCFLFPHYDPSVVPKLTELSAKECGFLLIQSHGNARNHPALGVPDISNIAKKCRAFQMTYSCTDDLEMLLNQKFLSSLTD